MKIDPVFSAPPSVLRAPGKADLNLICSGACCCGWEGFALAAGFQFLHALPTGLSRLQPLTFPDATAYFPPVPPPPPPVPDCLLTFLLIN